MKITPTTTISINLIFYKQINNRNTLFHLFQTFALNIKSGNSMSCGASLFTSIPTKRCPRNELEWNTRAAIFNCSSINQTCVKADKFEYHCVLNENVTGLVEVCAPSKHVFGQ